MDNIVITVARGFGSGGKEIASKVAKDLGISCYENRILTLASQLSGLDEELFNEVNERVREKGGFAAFMKETILQKENSFLMIRFLSIRKRLSRSLRQRNLA